MNSSKISVFICLLILATHYSAYIVLTNVFILLLGLFSLLNTEVLSKIRALFTSTTFWISTIPFLIYFLSLLITENISAGLKEIESKLGLILFPIIFGLLHPSNKNIDSILRWTIFLTCAYPIVGFINQYYIVQETGDTGYFYNDNLVTLFNKQAVYFAYFINTALLYLVYFVSKKDKFNRIDKLFYSISFIVLIIAQYLLASRTSLLISIVIIGLYVGWLSLKKLKKKQGILLIATSVLLLIGLGFAFPKVMVRFKNVSNLSYRFDNPNPINHFNGENTELNWNGFNTRLAIWSCSWELFKTSPWVGYGDGDVQDVLYKKYKEKNFLLAMNSNYNTHNQFFDILLSTGLIGLIFFLIYLGYFLKRAILTKNWVFLGFIAIFVISCLTENLLNRSQGLIFFAIFFSLLAFRNEKTTP